MFLIDIQFSFSLFISCSTLSSCFFSSCFSSCSFIFFSFSLSLDLICCLEQRAPRLLRIPRKPPHALFLSRLILWEAIVWVTSLLTEPNTYTHFLPKLLSGIATKTSSSFKQTEGRRFESYSRANALDSSVVEQLAVNQFVVSSTLTQRS